MSAITFPKEKKRRNSEKRKLKSRNAARTRREKETAIFYDLAHELPMPHSMCSQLDKAGIMRLLLSYLKSRKITPQGVKSEPLDFDSSTNMSTTIADIVDNYYLKALDGFAMMLSQSGDIVFISDNISQYIGLKQVDLIGQSIFEFSHPCDHEELKDHLCDHPRMTRSTKQPEKEERHNFLLRMKCTLTAKGKIVTQKAATYKVVNCNGLLKVAPSELTTSGYRLPEFNCLSLVAMPIHHPANIEIPIDKQTFLTRHNMDMMFTYCDDRIQQLLGYEPDDLVGSSFYEFFHVLDYYVIEKCHRNLFAKGQAWSDCYRFLAKKSGYAWMETQATVIYHAKTSKPQCVVCVNYMISGIEDEDTVSSARQLQNQISSELHADNTTNLPLHLRGSTSTLTEPDDLISLAPHAGSSVVPLDFGSPVGTGLQAKKLLQTTTGLQNGHGGGGADSDESSETGNSDFVPMLPFIGLAQADDKPSDDDMCFSQQPSPQTLPTPDLMVPGTSLMMSSSQDPLLLDTSLEAFANIPGEDLSMRAPYISMSDDFDFTGVPLHIDLSDTWEPVDLFGSTSVSTCEDSSPFKEQRTTPLCGNLTAPSTPYSQLVSPLTPVNELCKSLPNLLSHNDVRDSLSPQQQQQQTTDPFDKVMHYSPPPAQCLATSPPPLQIDLHHYGNVGLGKPQLPLAVGLPTRKRKLESRMPGMAESHKVVRVEDSGGGGGGVEGGGPGPGGGGGGGGEGSEQWSSFNQGLMEAALRPPESDAVSRLLSTLLFQPSTMNISSPFGHSLLLQKVAQQVINKQAGSARRANPPTSIGVDSRPTNLEPLDKLNSPSHQELLFPIIHCDDSSCGLTSASVLPLITRHDLEVNAPLQASSGLLHGEELLRALDVPWESGAND